MAISATNTAREIAFALMKKSPEIFENIFLQNGVLALMGVKGRVKIVKGSRRFDERVHLGQNPNVDTRSRFAQIPTDFPNNWYTAEYGQSVISGAVPVNLVEIDQAAGAYKLDDLAETCKNELKNTFANKVADKLMQASAGASDPVSLRQEIQATAFGSQTGTLGGINRADHKGLTDKTDAWQNQYRSTAISDVGASAGFAALMGFLWTCSPGGGALSEMPDLGITTTGVMAKMSGGIDALKRYQPNATMAKIGFDNLQVGTATLIADRNCPDGYLYFINTNYLHVQVLGGPMSKTIGEVKTIGDGKQTIPLQVRPAIESEDHLNIAIKAYMVYNLTFGGLRQHGLQTSITEA